MVKPIRLHGSVALQSFLDRAQMDGTIAAIRHLVAQACFTDGTFSLSHWYCASSTVVFPTFCLGSIVASAWSVVLGNHP
jgi:hypothetical protein